VLLKTNSHVLSVESSCLAVCVLLLRLCATINYTMLTSLTRNAGGRASAPVLDICPLPGHMSPVTNPRQGRHTRQLFSERGGCARGQMSVSVSHKYSSSSSSGGGGGRCLSVVAQLHLTACWQSGNLHYTVGHGRLLEVLYHRTR